MAKIDKSGTYKDDDGNFFVGKAGDAKPENWTYVGPTDDPGDDEAPGPEVRAVDEAPGPEFRAVPDAPENRMEPTTLQNRAIGKVKV